ncbi:hypothetical protein QYE76_005391 [Lolium multiflorum]|uniref:Transposase (putative) gypsy type domain-containing protein n=1 Tax=Lolium multiflorum TaxID=4521 RepID=A0AAD8RWD0_LOLMU|nr:hypothetical protein QYE76_005391 [Lolium multiflorum]
MWRPTNRTVAAQRLPAHYLSFLLKGERFLLLPFSAFTTPSRALSSLPPCAFAAAVRRQGSFLRRSSSTTSSSFAPQRPSAASPPLLLRVLLGDPRSSSSPNLVGDRESAASPATVDLNISRHLSEDYLSESSASNSRSETLLISFKEQTSAGQMGSSSNIPDGATGRGKEASSSGQGSGANPAPITRGAWKGSDVTQPKIDWLYHSRRIPAQVSCRLPRDEVEPVLEPGESVVFLAHFERGFGLPASNFFREFLDFYQLQPHHLPGNAIFYLSCYVSFMEGYIGLLPTKEAFARFFSLLINSVQGKDIPKPKPPVQCGSCIIGSRQGSPFFKFSGLESCRAWQETFFYVKNKGATDLINLPAYNPGTPTKANWSFNPGNNHIETNRIVRFMEQLMKDTNICSDDIIRTFISRRVLPLQRRSHKISQMCGPRDPTKITGLPLSKEDVVLKARQICQTDMPMDWE